MPLSTVAKAALCLCPPAVMAGAVATVPVVKRAVHHITAPHHAPRHIVTGATSARSKAQVAKQAGCDPVAPVAIPAAPIVTYAAPIPEEPAVREAVARSAAPGPAVAALANGPSVLAAPAVAPLVAAPVPVVPPVAVAIPSPVAVPETATWLMLSTGIGAIGGGLRRRRRRIKATALGLEVAGGATMWGVAAASEAGDVAATVAVKSAVVSAAGKAMLCICPAALVAGSVVAVPPLRQAVHAATIPDAPKPAVAGNYRTAVPCDGPMTVPVSATSIKGFPESVTTVTSPPQSAAPAGASAAVIPPVSPAQSD